MKPGLARRSFGSAAPDGQSLSGAAICAVGSIECRFCAPTQPPSAIAINPKIIQSSRVAFSTPFPFHDPRFGLGAEQYNIRTTMASPTTHAIIGTAGHIDHGKTALIKALTGQDTDRLKEEKERGISIDLGFAYFTLPDSTRAGIVDVPGHERFIRNMLAGAHGIDLVLFTVAADDGVMPQSEEHLDILHLLGIRRGIFIITKADLADAQRLAEVRDEVELLADGTALHGAPVMPVSSLTGAGLDGLRDEIARRLAG